MNRIAVMACANLEKGSGDYALDIQADRFPVFVGCSLRADAPTRESTLSELKIHGRSWVPGKTYIRDLPLILVSKAGKGFFPVTVWFDVEFPFSLAHSDAQIKFSLWQDDKFTNRLWDMDWIHTFAGLEKWQGQPLPRLG